MLCVLWSLALGCGGIQEPSAQSHSRSHVPFPFIASVDTMKESKDTENHPLSDAQIANDVNLSASLNVNYITVDTHFDNADYMARWVSAIRATGKHVWFRPGIRGWATDPSGALTPALYLQRLRAFILAHPSLFRPGDVFDPNAEPENGSYWSVTYGPNWSWQPAAPNAATDAFNQFIIDTTAVANRAFNRLGIHGVITTVHSVSPWIASHPDVLYPSTIRQMRNVVTVDAYPDADATDPEMAASAWIQQVEEIHKAQPDAYILIGEMGYSLNTPVDDATQASVLRAELDALSHVPYLIGVNYWVGAGTDQSGGFTHIFSGSAGDWALRPAALVLKSYFAAFLSEREREQSQGQSDESHQWLARFAR